MESCQPIKRLRDKKKKKKKKKKTTTKKKKKKKKKKRTPNTLTHSTGILFKTWTNISQFVAISIPNI